MGVLVNTVMIYQSLIKKIVYQKMYVKSDFISFVYSLIKIRLL